MTTPENPEEGQTPEDTQETTQGTTVNKPTKRTRRTSTKKADDSDTLKDTQQVVEQAREQLGSSVSPGRYLYQTSQFDVQSAQPDVLKHLANPTEGAVKAKEASDARFKQSEEDTGN